MVHLLGPTTSSLTMVCAGHHLRQDGGTEPSQPITDVVATLIW